MQEAAVAEPGNAQTQAPRALRPHDRLYRLTAGDFFFKAVIPGPSGHPFFRGLRERDLWRRTSVCRIEPTK